MQKLTYAVSTLGERIHNIHLPETRDDVKILIIWQNPMDKAPHWENRPDLHIIKMTETGLSKSRNKAISECSTEFLWIADDDIEPNIDKAIQVCAEMDTKPATQVSVCRVNHPDGTPFKNYPEGGPSLKKHQVAGVSSIEIILRPEFLRKNAISLDENFGLGAKWTMGEEFILLCDIIRRKGIVKRNTTILATHPKETTGSNYQDPKIWRASSAAIMRAFGSPVGYLARLAMLFKKRSIITKWADRLTFLTIKI